MSDELSTQVLNAFCGLFLLAAIGVLWRRQVSSLIALLTVQGLALTGIAASLAAHERSREAMGIAVAVGILKAGIVPWMLRRVHAFVPDARETRPLVNVAASLLAAAGLKMQYKRVKSPSYPSGTILGVSPAAGTMLPVGSTVTVTVAR